MKMKDITGMRFGKLVVLEKDKATNRKTYWIVRCDC
jgi:hypothetical protein